jgi:Ca2+-binding RTX toxin-like protein
MSLFNGTSGNDNLVGTSGGDTIFGLDGNDSLNGGLGDDTLYGGAGADRFEDRYGQNHLYGEDGADVFEVNIMLLDLDGVNVTVSGGAGQDQYNVSYWWGNRDYVVTDFAAGAGGDRIDVYTLLTWSSEHYEHYNYTGGDPFALGLLRLVQSGADTLLQCDADGPSNGVDGVLSTPGWVTVLVLQNFTATSLTSENFVTGLSPDGASGAGQLINGTADTDSLVGGFFNDTVNGLGGDDQLFGGFGNDQLDGGTGGDRLSGGIGNDLVLGGDDDDVFPGNESFGDFGDDTLYGGSGADRFEDWHGQNHMYGEDGNDVFDVNRASITISGGAGQDRYTITYVSADRDCVVSDFAVGSGGDLIDVSDLLIDSGARYNSYTGGNPFAQGVLRLEQSGADTLLQWDADGPGSSTGWVTALVLQNFTATSLTSENFVAGLSPDGAPGAGQLINGTADADSLVGGFFNDTVNGLAGDDQLSGGFGNDLMLGGDDDDVFLGNESFGDDTLYGGSGADRFEDWYGQNYMYGEGGADVFVVNGASNNVVTDFAVGLGGDLIDVSGYAGGNPFARGVLRLEQSGADTLLQWDADGPGSPTGWVTVLVLQNITATSLTSENFIGQEIFGTVGNDSLVGTLDDDSIVGLGGDDTLNGTLGADWLEGGAGNDYYIITNDGDVVVEVGNAAEDGTADTVFLWSGFDYVLGAHLENLVFQASGSLHASLSYVDGIGNELDNHLWGNNTNNLLEGLGGNDSIWGGSASDTVTGGQGNDTLDGDEGNDSIVGGEGNDSLLGGMAHDSLIGGDGNDTLSGNTGLDSLEGGAGDDSMLGNRGFDTLRGDAGDDFMWSNRGFDWLFGEDGSDTLDGGAGFDTLLGGADADLVIGSAGNDSIEGNSGADTIVGGIGSDTMFGDTETDVYRYDATSLNAVDVVANTADSIVGGQGDLISMLGLMEELLIGGMALSALTSDTAIGSALSANTNIAFTDGVLQIDLDGSGDFNAASDFSIALNQGVTSVTFDAATDLLLLA